MPPTWSAPPTPTPNPPRKGEGNASLLRDALAQHHLALEQELLGPFPGVDLSRVDVAARVDRDVVHPVELARLAAVAAEGSDHLAGVAHERAHLVVGAVGIEQEGLAGVGEELKVPDRAVRQRVLLDEDLL